MEILVCIDDTDNLESRGTGDLAVDLVRALEQNDWGRASYISRHQLLVHPDIPYTSHNSSMCFEASVREDALEPFIDYASGFLVRESAPGSDPGLCVADTSRFSDQQRLVDFGRSAKQQVLSKEDAYGLAKELDLHLSEHGGTGQGVVGALAGVGLRLGGNDGRLKGWLEFAENPSVLWVAELCDHPHVDRVQTLEGQVLEGPEAVRIGDRPKTVLLAGQLVLLVCPVAGQDGVSWETCHRRQLKKY